MDKHHRAFFLSLLWLLVPSVAVSGPIDDTFKGGVFGLPWGSDTALVEAKFPGGTWLDRGGNNYRVLNSRSVLGVARENKPMSFNHDYSGRLTLVSIQFDLGKSLAVAMRAEKAFGPPTTGTLSDFIQFPEKDMALIWEDNGFSFVVLRNTKAHESGLLPSGTLVVINAEGSEALRSKKALGFE